MKDRHTFMAIMIILVVILDIMVILWFCQASAAKKSDTWAAYPAHIFENKVTGEAYAMVHKGGVSEVLPIETKDDSQEGA